MIVKHLLIFSFALFVTISAHKGREKRDIGDLSNDALLRAVFMSDAKETRKDRSISLTDEQETNQKTFKLDERRAINPAQEYFSNGPIISNSQPVFNTAPSAGFQASQSSQSVAVDPALVAANFMPLPQQKGQPSSDQSNMNGVKKSSMPDSSPPVSSYPLQLHIHSPNAAIQGVAPHFEEFGETVESIQRAQKAQKRFSIPKPEMYDSEIVKKNSIPHPQQSKHKTKKSKIRKSKQKSKILKPSTKITRRQFIPQTQSYMYNMPAYMNSMQSNSLYAQQPNSMMQFQSPQQQQVAPQVQNLDGAITRPIISGEECSDQYAQCGDFAKNGYCANFQPQMKIQCRKSCHFCVPKTTKAASKSSATASQRDESADLDSGSGSGSGEADDSKKVVEEPAKKRHDVLQERGHVTVPSDDAESGSGSDDESGSGEPTGNTSDITNKNLDSNSPSNKESSDVEDESGSGSGSGDVSGESEVQETSVKQSDNSKSQKVVKQDVKRMKIPHPLFNGAYPRIDLKAIASALAHYEEAALELAGEYPKPQDVDMTEYTRSFIPHPVNVEEVRENRNRQNIQIAKIITAERARKSNIPKFLRVASDAKKKDDIKVSDADSIDEVQQRFVVPGVEPTLNDYYAETGRINPFERKTKNFKKSRIENSMLRNGNYDPYQYLRNMPAGASMEPIIDPSKRSEMPSDHSYPVFLMKVSPADEKKYVDEPAERRGKIRHFDDEGIQVSEDRLKEIQRQKIAQYEAETLSAVPLAAVTQRSNAPVPQNVAIQQNVDASTRSAVPQVAAPQVAQYAPVPAPAPAPAQQMQPDRYASAFPEQQPIQPNGASLFANAEPLGFEQQPGENSLKGKMLSAFFDVKSSDGSMDGSGAGSGDNSEVGSRSVVWPGGFKK